MSYEEVKEMMERTKFTEYHKHCLLVNMSCVYEDGDGRETEVIFAVPSEWVLKTLQKWSEWSWSDLHKWLDSEYTSEDSQSILERAIAENKVAFWKIN